MLYQPGTVFNVARALNQTFTNTILSVAADFIAGNNKPWTFYAGSVLGYAALASGIPGAAATIYCVGDTVDALLFKSPDGSDVRVFLNGVQAVSLDTYAVAAVWETLNITGLVGGQVNRLDFVNFGASANQNATGVMWLALGPITINGIGAYAQGANPVAYDRVIWRTQDSESDANYGPLWLNIPTGFTLAEIQAWVTAVTPELDALTGGKIVSVEVNLALTLPGGLKASPVTNVLNERGGIISFVTAGPQGDSVRIPAFDPAKLTGDTFSLADSDVAALITRLTTATTAANIRPVSDKGYNFISAVGGKKSFRKK